MVVCHPLLKKLLLNDASFVLRPCAQFSITRKVVLILSSGGHPVLVRDALVLRPQIKGES